MPTIVHGFNWPDRVVIGTVGEPGARSFYLQARAGAQSVSVALEKQQSAALAETIEEILATLASDANSTLVIPATTPLELIDNEPLDQPVQPEFRVGAISLGWDPATAQIVIEAFPLVLGDEDSAAFEDSAALEDSAADEPAEMLVIRIPVGTARAFATRTREVVNAGR